MYLYSDKFWWIIKWFTHFWLNPFAIFLQMNLHPILSVQIDGVGVENIRMINLFSTFTSSNPTEQLAFSSVDVSHLGLPDVSTLLIVVLFKSEEFCAFNFGFVLGHNRQSVRWRHFFKFSLQIQLSFQYVVRKCVYDQVFSNIPFIEIWLIYVLCDVNLNIFQPHCIFVITLEIILTNQCENE